MSISHESSADVLAVHEAIAKGQAVDPQVKKRIHDRGEAIRADIRRRLGLVNVAVDLVREARDHDDE